MTNNILIAPNEKTEFFVIKKGSEVNVCFEWGLSLKTIFRRDTTFSRSWFEGYCSDGGDAYGVFNHKYDDVAYIFTDKSNIIELEELEEVA